MLHFYLLLPKEVNQVTSMNNLFYFKVGDLVRKRETRSYDDPEYPELYKKPLIGVVVKIALPEDYDLWGGHSERKFDMVRVMWNNYGSFWTSTGQLILLARGHGDEKNKIEQK